MRIYMVLIKIYKISIDYESVILPNHKKPLGESKLINPLLAIPLDVWLILGNLLEKYLQFIFFLFIIKQSAYRVQLSSDKTSDK